MRDQWAALFKDTGLARAYPPNQVQRDAMMLEAIGQLVRADCAGRSSMTPTADTVLIDGMPVCATFRADAELATVEGLPVFGGERGLAALADACTARHAVNFGMKNGAALTVPCAAPYQAQKEFYRVDIDKVLARLVVSRP